MEPWYWRLLQGDCQWQHRNLGATDLEIQQLEAYFGSTLPPDYEAFLRFANGASISTGEGWFVRVWNGSDVREWAAAYGIVDPDYPGAKAVGDDGGDNCVVFDARTPQEAANYSLYELPFVSTSWKDAFLVASLFSTYVLEHLHLVTT
jgi:hypothetical protein